jgi:choline dehydrogenase-like flavoprotein
LRPRYRFLPYISLFITIALADLSRMRGARYRRPRRSDGMAASIPGLRVTDASISPTDCQANTHVATAVIGETTGEPLRATRWSVFHDGELQSGQKIC